MRRNNGWTKKGLICYNELVSLVKNNRLTKGRKKMEEMYKEHCKSQMSKMGKRVGWASNIQTVEVENNLN